MAPNSHIPNKVVIIGAGLGGLTCAIQCRQMGLEVVVLERAPEISNVGAGIQIPPNASRVLQRLGILSKFESEATFIEASYVRRYEDGRILFKKEQGANTMKWYGVPWMVIHRQDYHTILLEEAKRFGAKVMLNSCVKNIYITSNMVILENGTKMGADVIIGADGLWSVTRDIILGHPAPPTETGDLAYRATFTHQQLMSLKSADVEELCAQNASTLWLGPDRHAMFYPLRGGEEFNLVLLRPDNLPTGSRTVKGEIEEMRATFEGWDKRLTQLISCISSVLKWKLMHHEELRTWTMEHIALLGDACHASLPYQAQGAAMAVEDGAVLGVLIGRLKAALESSQGCPVPSSINPIKEVLQLYERLRKPRTTLNVQGAIRNRWLYHMPDGEEQERRDSFFANVKDWNNVDAPMYTLVDSKYQQELLGYDSVGAANAEFDSWWTSWEGCNTLADVKSR